MHISTRKTRATAVVACLTALLALSSSTAAGRGVSSNEEELPGDRAVPFWPYETGALVGTSETYVDVRADGSYFDPSIGRRVFAVR